jgi:hypothetical protein
MVKVSDNKHNKLTDVTKVINNTNKIKQSEWSSTGGEARQGV